MVYPPRQRLLFILFLVALCLVSSGVLAACAQNTTNAPSTKPPAANPAPSQATITTIDLAYQMPATLPAGYVDLTLVNRGAELHEAQLVLLNDGVTFDQFKSALLAQGLTVLLLHTFSITISGTIIEGAQTWQVENKGAEPYELNLVKLVPGKTEQDVIAFYTAPAGPPPFVNLGGMAALSRDLVGWVNLNLVAGNYVALSLVIDKATGKPDFLLGMITSFTVA